MDHSTQIYYYRAALLGEITYLYVVLCTGSGACARSASDPLPLSSSRDFTLEDPVY